MDIPASPTAGNQAETQQARVDLAAVFRMTARLNMHEGVCNHISVMLPGRRFLINPKGTSFERITAGGLLVINEHGTTIEGTGRAPTTGFTIHTRIHMNHPRARVVMHPARAVLPPRSPPYAADGCRWCTRTAPDSSATSPMTTTSTA